jgi:hypothetical protein
LSQNPGLIYTGGLRTINIELDFPVQRTPLSALSKHIRFMFKGERKGPEDLKTHPRSAHSVGDPDPHVFGPPGSGSESISQRYGSLPFYHKYVERTEIMPAK